MKPAAIRAPTAALGPDYRGIGSPTVVTSSFHAVDEPVMMNGRQVRFLPGAIFRLTADAG